MAHYFLAYKTTSPMHDGTEERITHSKINIKDQMLKYITTKNMSGATCPQVLAERALVVNNGERMEL